MTAIELMPVHQFVQDTTLKDQGLANYWGYNTIGFFAPHNAYSATGQRGQQVQEFKSMVKALHEADIEVILDVVYNHTAEGNELGPTIVLPRHRQRGVLPARRRRQGPLLRHHGHRELPADAAPARAAADHGLVALLGARDARRRLPLRPRLVAGPAVPRGRPAVGVLRPGPAGPDRQPGQADRRAVGRRRRRLPGRQLPAAVDRVERPLPRHGPRLLARRARQRSASSPRDSPGPRTSTSTRAASRSRRSTSSPPTTASRSATWSPTTRSTTRPTARATTTGRATTGRGTAASRATPTTRTCSRCGLGSIATSW